MKKSILALALSAAFISSASAQDITLSVTHLPVVAMVLPANDGFVGLNGLPIPTDVGSYTFDLNAYDAGTEANDAFSDVNSIELDAISTGQSAVYFTHVYDAGTEFNSEPAGTIAGPADSGTGFDTARDDVAAVLTLHPGVVTAAEGFANSTLSSDDKFDNPALRIPITAL